MSLEEAVDWCVKHDVTLEFRRGGPVYPAEHVVAWVALGSAKVTWPGRTMQEAVLGLRRALGFYAEEGKG